MRKIVVVPHENHWGEKFQMEAERLKAAMPEKGEGPSYWKYVGARTGSETNYRYDYGSREYRQSR